MTSNLMLPAVLVLAGCGILHGKNDGGDDTGDPGDDAVHAVLVVLDNSDSMQEEAAALAFADLPGALAGTSYRLDLTTTNVQPNNPDDLVPGDEGSSVLSGVSITSDDADPSGAFRTALLCQATCFGQSSVPSDPSYTCDPGATPDEVSQEYLDCLCGDGAWLDHCGSGNEMGLEASELLLCRTGSSANGDCSTYTDGRGDQQDSSFTTEDVGTVDLLDGADDLDVLIISDEGDGSYRQATGDADGAVYAGLLGAWGASVSVVGPWYEDQGGDCLDGAQPWAVERYQAVAVATGGQYIAISTGPDDGCAQADMGSVLLSFADTL